MSYLYTLDRGKDSHKGQQTFPLSSWQIVLQDITGFFACLADRLPWLSTWDTLVLLRLQFLRMLDALSSQGYGTPGQREAKNCQRPRSLGSGGLLCKRTIDLLSPFQNLVSKPARLHASTPQCAECLPQCPVQGWSMTADRLDTPR